MLNEKKRSLGILSYFMAMLLIANIFMPYEGSYAEFGSEHLSVKTIQITQNGPIAPGGEIKSDEPFAFHADLEVKIGPGGIQKDQELKIPIGSNLEDTELPSAKTITLTGYNPPYTLGTYELIREGQILYAKIVFNGTIFDATDDTNIVRDEEGNATIPFWISGALQYAKNGEAIEIGGIVIEILGTGYKFLPAQKDFGFAMTKKGEVVSGETGMVLWTIEIHPSNPSSKIPLAGYRFEDDLSKAGKYVKDSFKINDEVKTPVYEGDKLEYKFPDNFTEKTATVTFATEIPNDVYFGKTSRTYSNTANLYLESDLVAKATSENVTFTPQWISKNGEDTKAGSTGIVDADPSGRYITWKITANGNEASLKNMYIEDKLSPDLEFGRASYQVWDWSKNSGKGDWGDEHPVPRIEGDKYYFGPDGAITNKKILLKLVTKVKNIPSNHNGEDLKFTNSATLGWDGGTIGTKPIEATIGFNKIYRRAVPHNNMFSEKKEDYVGGKINGRIKTIDGKNYTNASEMKIAWETTAELIGELPDDAKIYEVYLYNDTGYNSSELPGLQGKGIQFTEEVWNNKDPLKTTTATQQRFVDFIDHTGDTLRHTVEPIMKDGKRVGDLLIITGLQKDQKAQYTTISKVVSPKRHISINNNNKWNKRNNSHTPMFSTAMLYSASTELTHATAESIIPYHTIFKDVMHRDAVAKPMDALYNHVIEYQDGKVKYPGGIARGNLESNVDALTFDYKEKAVLYHLTINPDNVDFPNTEFFDAKTGEFKKYGTITVEDQLMPGWEFVPVQEGNDPQKPFIFLAAIDKKRWSANEDATKLYDERDFVSRDARTEVAGSPGNWTVVQPPSDMQFSLEIKNTGGRGIRQVATFTFPTLDKAYVVVMKARPTEAKMKELFSQEKRWGRDSYGNQTLDFANYWKFKAENYETGREYSASIVIDSKPLSKKADNSHMNDGYLLWHVDLKIDGMDPAGIRLEDTLPQGVDLPLNADGNVVLNKNGRNTFRIIEIEPNADGSYKAKDPVSEVLITNDDIGKGKMIDYNNSERKIIFTPPAGEKKAYRFEYLTEITTQNLGNITNTAKLFGLAGGTSASASEKVFVATTAAGGTLSKGGSVYIEKQDSSDANKKLPKVTFVLLSSKTGVQLRSGTTKDGGRLQFDLLPEGEYILKETEAPDGYELSSASYAVKIERNSGKYITTVSGQENNATTPFVVKNTPKKPDAQEGSLLVDNQVYRIKKDHSREAVKNVKFEYTVTFTGNGSDKTYGVDKYDVSGNKIPGSFTVKSGETILLKHGEKFIIPSLPAGLQVSVTEKVIDGYTVTSQSTSNATITSTNKQTEIIATKAQKEIHFINTIPEKDDPGTGGGGIGGGTGKGDLIVTNKVDGEAADHDPKIKEFIYTFTIDDTNSYSFEKINQDGSKTTGTIKSGDPFKLKDGEQIVIQGLPAGKDVTVTEDKEDAKQYTITPGTAIGTGTIVQDDVITIPFKNIIAPGDVQISNTVTGEGDPNKDFVYTVTFDGGGSYSYTKVKADGNLETGNISSGGTFTLKHAETFTIHKMPPGLKVTVTQTHYSDYHTSPSLARYDYIVAKMMIYMPFVNTKQSAGGGGGGTPSQPTSPVRPDPSNPDTIVPDPTPLSPNTPDTSGGSDTTKTDTSSVIGDGNIPKQGQEKSEKTKSQKIAGAPKTGAVSISLMMKNTLLYGTILLLLLAVIEEYSGKKRY